MPWYSPCFLRWLFVLTDLKPHIKVVVNQDKFPVYLMILGLLGLLWVLWRSVCVHMVMYLCMCTPVCMSWGISGSLCSQAVQNQTQWSSTEHLSSVDHWKLNIKPIGPGRSWHHDVAEFQKHRFLNFKISVCNLEFPVWWPERFWAIPFSRHSSRLTKNCIHFWVYFIYN
jgi:hypothetical protein